jgi:hypothetical protein
VLNLLKNPAAAIPGAFGEKLTVFGIKNRAKEK